MKRPPPSGWVWLVVYLAMLGGIAGLIAGLRGPMLASLDSPEETEGWQNWREAAAKQDGKHGPVERDEQPGTEPPMRILLRDHFGLVMVGVMIFPGLILGFLLLMLRGVWMQSATNSLQLPRTVDE